MGGAAKNAVAVPKAPRERRDYLDIHSRKAVVFLVLLAGGLLYASMRSSHSEADLPGIAFGWEFALDVIRAGIVFAVVVVVVMVLVRGWGGLWPQRISTTGFDWPELSTALLDLKKEEAKLAELKEELESAGSRP